MTNLPDPRDRIVITADDLMVTKAAPAALLPAISAWGSPGAGAASLPPVAPAIPMESSKIGTNGMAIASLVCGILGISVLALVFGYVARSQMREPYNRQEGRGLATAGIVLGWIGVALVVLYVIVVVVLLAALASSVPSNGG